MKGTRSCAGNPDWLAGWWCPCQTKRHPLSMWDPPQRASVHVPRTLTVATKTYHVITYIVEPSTVGGWQRLMSQEPTPLTSVRNAVNHWMWTVTTMTSYSWRVIPFRLDIPLVLRYSYWVLKNKVYKDINLDSEKRSFLSRASVSRSLGHILTLDSECPTLRKISAECSHVSVSCTF